MNSVTMTDIRCGKLVIPGGWKAVLPAVSVDDADAARWEAHFSKHLGRTAGQHLTRIANEALTRGWMLGLRKAVRDWAREHYRVNGSLDSFRPERLQFCYLPGVHVGRKGNPELRRLR